MISDVIWRVFPVQASVISFKITEDYRGVTIMTDLSPFFKKLTIPLDRPYKRIIALCLPLCLLAFSVGICIVQRHGFPFTVFIWGHFTRLYIDSYILRVLLFLGYSSIPALLCSYGAKYWLDPLIVWIKNGNPKG